MKWQKITWWNDADLPNEPGIYLFKKRYDTGVIEHEYINEPMERAWIRITYSEWKKVG